MTKRLFNALAINNSKKVKQIKYLDNIEVYPSNPNISNLIDNELTPLHEAVLSGHMDKVARFCVAKADVKICVNYPRLIHPYASKGEYLKCHGDNIAHLAMQAGKIDIIKFISTINIDLFKDTNSLSLTPLGSAAAAGQLAAISIFLKNIVPCMNNYNLKNENATTVALMTKNADSLKLLLQYGCKVNNHDDNRVISGPDMRVAIMHNHSIEILNLLYKYGGDVNATSQGRTCLESAVELTKQNGKNSLSIVKFLLSKGARVKMDTNNNSDVSKQPNMTIYNICKSISNYEVSLTKNKSLNLLKQKINNELSKATIIDSLCSGGLDLVTLDAASMRYLNFFLEDESLSRISHKIMHRGIMTVREIVENANSVRSNIYSHGACMKILFSKIMIYLDNFIENIQAYQQQVLLSNDKLNNGFIKNNKFYNLISQFESIGVTVIDENMLTEIQSLKTEIAGAYYDNAPL